MGNSVVRSVRRQAMLLAFCSSAALSAPALRAQQPVATGTITGRVLEQGTNAPLAAVQVFVAGTTRGATTTEAGTYRILGVTPGNVQVHWPEGNRLIAGGVRSPKAGIPDYNAQVTIKAA